MIYETYTERKGAMHRTKVREVPEIFNNDKGTRNIDTSKLLVSIELNGVQTEFQVDEISQNRLVVKGYFMQAKGIVSTKWKDSSNNIVDISYMAIADILEQVSILQDALWEV